MLLRRLLLRSIRSSTVPPISITARSFAFFFSAEEAAAGRRRCKRRLRIKASAASTFEIQRQLVKAALAVDSSGGVRSSYSPVSPSSVVFQVIVGGAVIVGSGAAAARNNSIERGR
ncbi:unnamed protein product [Vicia faba]|uniref:Uncharacterized protein n=1 Tax=Vicia faba TaxID=3906 RepID=A0AAV0YVK1_VICFA|nr:unnamed protein product [Vicia faba]